MFSLFKIFKKEPNKTEKMCYMEIIEDYSKEYNTEPNYVEDFSVHCLYNMPKDFIFGMTIKEKTYYFEMNVLEGDSLEKVWLFLENIVKYGYGKCFFCIDDYYKIQSLYAVEHGGMLRVMYLPYELYDIKNKNGSFVWQAISLDKTVQFDIIIEKTKFVYEFYKELFSMFYNKETPDIHCEEYQTKIIKESSFLRGYFGDLSDEEIMLSRNPKTYEGPI